MRKLKFLFLCILFFAPPLTASTLACKGVFRTGKINQPAQAEALLEIIDKSLAELKSKEFPVTNEEMASLRKQGSSFRVFASLSRVRRDLRAIFWNILEDKIFSSPSLENQTFIRKVEALYNQYSEHFMPFPRSEELVKKIKKGKLNAKSKEKFISLVKAYSYIFSQIYGRKIDLLKEDDLLEVFKVQSRIQIKPRESELERKNNELNQRVRKFFNSQQKRTSGSIQEELVQYFFGTIDGIFAEPHVGSFFERNASYQETVGLSKSLGLKKEERESLLEDLAILKTMETEGIHPATIHITFALAVIKYSERVYGPFHFYYNPRTKIKSLSSQNYITLKTQIEQSEIVRAVIEERMASYLSKSEKLNNRIEEALEDLKWLEKKRPNYTKIISPLESELNSLIILDFDRNIDSINERIFRVESKLDNIREEIATRQQREQIESFIDLNNRWGRLLPEKNYQLEGVDYKEVSFSKTVIDDFSKNPLLGTRFLAALSKSYVTVKGESGLRRLRSIHPQFRDIKIIRAHGKIRVVGKLIGETIHFFYVYHSEKSYINKLIQQKVENYEPNP